MAAPVPSPRLRRSRSDAVLGGVCAGVARSAGLDPLLLRIAVVAVSVLTGGAGLLAYLAAWVLIPAEDVTGAPPPGADRPGPPLERAADAAGAEGGAAPSSGGGSPTADVRAAWTAVGNDLRSLAAELRRPAPSTTRPPEAAGATRPPEAAGAGPADVATSGTGAPTAHAPTAGTAPGDPAGADAATEPPAGTVPSPRSPLSAADEAATALGDRLRAPEVQAGARRAAASVSQALTASVDEIGRRIRRDPS
jgi:phage shock protein PspC (stress-responsive transcriptional regulator)